MPCPDYNTNQKEVSMTMIVEEPFKEPMISKLFIGGYKELQQYVMEMRDGILDFEVDKGNWKYTYHNRIASYGSKRSFVRGLNQFDFIIEDTNSNENCPFDNNEIMLLIPINSSFIKSSNFLIIFKFK